MLNFPTNTNLSMKCNVKYGTLGHLDPKQPPVKRSPFSAILSHQFISRVELILPEEIYEIIKDDLFGERLCPPTYSRVILPLRSLLEGEFFTEYIKRGNVLLLSEGRVGVENVYSLQEGILTLHLDKETYERAGLVGKPAGVKGKRGTRPRWIVEINLRQPSMLHGKKGFDRVLYACKNVLTAPVTWLFCDLAATAVTPDPLDQHFPTKISCLPTVLKDIKVNMPSLRPPSDTGGDDTGDFEDFAVETLEWLSLISLDSPRINPDDQIDSFLSRYVPPSISTTSSGLVKISWRGFLSPSWAHKAFVQTLLLTPRDAWFAYCAAGFSQCWSGDGKDCTILKLPDSANEYVLWEVA